MAFTQRQKEALSQGTYDGVRFSTMPMSDLLLEPDLGQVYAAGYLIGRAVYFRHRMVLEYRSGGIICVLGAIICALTALPIGVLLFLVAGGFIVFNWKKNKPTLPNPPAWFLLKSGVSPEFMAKVVSSQVLREALAIGRVQKISDHVSTRDTEAISNP